MGFRDSVLNPLPANSVDGVYICDTCHHLECPQPMLATIRKALKRRGEILLVEFKRVPGVSSEWMMGHVRAGQEVFAAYPTAWMRPRSGRGRRGGIYIGMSHMRHADANRGAT